MGYGNTEVWDMRIQRYGIWEYRGMGYENTEVWEHGSTCMGILQDVKMRFHFLSLN